MSEVIDWGFGVVEMREKFYTKEFVISELEKIKAFINKTPGMVGHEWQIDRFKVLEYIENEIKELGGEENE